MLVIKHAINSKEGVVMNTNTESELKLDEKDKELLQAFKKRESQNDFKGYPSNLWDNNPQLRLATLIDIYSGKHPSIRREANPEKTTEFVTKLIQYCQKNDLGLPKMQLEDERFSTYEKERLHEAKMQEGKKLRS